MDSVADKMKEISLSDDSGIDSPTGDVNTENSREVETEALTNTITENEEASVKGFEEATVDATVGRASKAAGKIQSLYLLILTSELTSTDISVLQQIHRKV